MTISRLRNQVRLAIGETVDGMSEAQVRSALVGIADVLINHLDSEGELDDMEQIAFDVQEELGAMDIDPVSVFTGILEKVRD